MPAEQILHHSQPADQPHQNYPYEASVSPSTHGPTSFGEGAHLEQQNRQQSDLPLHSGRKIYQEHNEPRMPERTYVPPPADFTTYRPTPTTLPATSPSGYTPASNESNTRKRNYEETEEGSTPARPPPEDLVITQAQRASLEAAIDPSLSTTDGNASTVTAPSNSQNPPQKGKSKEELEAEVKRMRELLLAAEGELAKLNGNEQSTTD